MIYLMKITEAGRLVGTITVELDDPASALRIFEEKLPEIVHTFPGAIIAAMRIAAQTPEGDRQIIELTGNHSGLVLTNGIR